MSIKTLTRPLDALPEGDHVRVPDLPTRVARSPRSARSSRPGAGRFLRSLLPSHDRHAAPVDHAMLLGPSGGPIWTSRPL